MAIFVRFLLLLTITHLIVREGEALRCWSCNSNGIAERGCGDPFGGSTDYISDVQMFSRDCDEGTPLRLYPGAPHFYSDKKDFNITGLMDVCYKLTGISLGEPSVLRGCAMGMPDITSGSCMHLNPGDTTGGRIVTCDTCSGDYCNGAGMMKETAEKSYNYKSARLSVVTKSASGLRTSFMSATLAVCATIIVAR